MTAPTTNSHARMTTPCENCPYRMDAPQQFWHRSEFERVLEAERSEFGTTFACHKQVDLPQSKRGLCAGWLLDQRNRGLPSLRLRMLLLSDQSAVAALEAVNDGGHEMFPSVEAMCRANGVRPKRRR